MREFTHSLTIEAPPDAVMNAFFDPAQLERWWQVKRSMCMPRVLGSYVVEWEPTEYRDEVLGRLGGVLRGTVMEYKPARELFVADVYYLPPDGDPLGPMAFEATCTVHGTATVLHVRQSGWDKSARWSRYYDVVSTGLTLALEQLKRVVERPPG